MIHRDVTLDIVVLRRYYEIDDIQGEEVARRAQTNNGRTLKFGALKTKGKENNFDKGSRTIRSVKSHQSGE